MKLWLTAFLILFSTSVIPLFAEEGHTTVPVDIRIFHDSIFASYQVDSEKAQNYANYVKALAEKKKDQRLNAWYHFYEGLIAEEEGKLDIAEDAYTQTLDLAGRLPITDHRLMSTLCNFYSSLLRQKGQFDDYRRFTWLAYTHTRMINDDDEMAETLYSLGVLFVELGNYREAVKYVSEALVIDQKLDNQDNVAYDLAFLANMNFKLKEYDIAADHYSESLLLTDSIVDPRVYAARLSALSDVQTQMGMSEEALSNAQRSLSLANRTTSLIQQCRSKIQYAQAMGGVGFSENAVDLLREVRQLAKEEGLIKEGIRADIILGKMIPAQQAIPVLQDAKNLATIHQLNEYLELIYPLLLDQLKTSNQPVSLTRDLQSEYIDFLTEVSQHNLSAAEEGLQQGFDLIETERELQIATLTSQVQKEQLSNSNKLIALLGGSLIFLLLGAVGFYLILHQKRQINDLETEAEISALKSQMLELLASSESTIHLPALEEFNKTIDNPLTNKEFEILKEIITKKSNTEIAKAHHISINTVKFHLKNIYSKMDVLNKREVLKRMHILTLKN